MRNSLYVRGRSGMREEEVGSGRKEGNVDKEDHSGESNVMQEKEETWDIGVGHGRRELEEGGGKCMH